MRWFMLPVSAAAHVAAFLLTLKTVTFRFSLGDRDL
jgi:hypothetical protein